MGKRIRNLLGTLLLITAVAVTQIPATDVEADNTAPASDFEMDGTTLVKYNGTAQDVSISDYVEKIESEAFAGNPYVKSIWIGGNVESIGSRAFAECTNLKEVVIPDSVVSIDVAAFAACPLLDKLSIGNGLKELGNGAFAGDYMLSEVSFSTANPYFFCTDGAIYEKNGESILYAVLSGRPEDTYKMPVSIKQIKPYAFWGDYNLQSIYVGCNVEEIPGYAFSNCKNLQFVDLPYSVNTLDMKSFEDCVRLRRIFIPPSVHSIHSTAFDGCTKLEIDAESGTEGARFAQNLVLEDIEVSEYEEAPIPGREEEQDDEESFLSDIPVDYYHEVTHIDPMEIEDDEVKGVSRIIGQQAFVLVDNASATVNVGSTGEKLGNNKEQESLEILDTIAGIGGDSDKKGGGFPKYTVVNKTKIATQAYYCDVMSSFEIPEEIENIGDFAFARSGLQSITIPDGLQQIGYAAFYHCDNLTNVTIPETVTEIAPYAFAKTPWYEDWLAMKNSGSPFLIVGDGILLGYRGSEKVVAIPGNVKQIGPEAFRGHAEIEQLVIPENVQNIGEAAFMDCANLRAVTFSDGLLKISDRAFSGCPIDMVQIPRTVEKIGLRAFEHPGDGSQHLFVFLGESLPKLSYEKSATRVYRDAYRDTAISGYAMAVVPYPVKEFDGTILAEGTPGFDGVVCRMKKDEDSEQGILQILRQDETTYVAGSTFEINAIPYVVEANPYSVRAAARTDSDVGIVHTGLKSYSIENSDGVSAKLEGASGSYTLQITDSNEAKKQIGDVYKSMYGNKLPSNLKGYDITLVEDATGIPITHLGKQEMSVTIPMPKDIDAEALHVVCLDEDGQLEDLTCYAYSTDMGDCITFTAKHFSYYGIYNYSSNKDATAIVSDGKAVFTSLGKKDASPDTGDYSIHPKWFLALGLVFSALALFFFKKKDSAQ